MDFAKFFRAALRYKKAIAAAVAASFTTYGLFAGGLTEAEALTLVPVWLGVVAVYLARNAE